MCPPNMLPCVHVSVLLARILTTPTLRFQQPYKSLGVGGYLQGKAWSYISQGSYYDGLTTFSCMVSVQYPSTSVCIIWYGRKLITIISHLVPSKKQISGIGATSLIYAETAAVTVFLSVCLSVSVCLFLFLSCSMIPSPNSSNGTTESIAATAAVHWRVLQQCAR